MDSLFSESRTLEDSRQFSLGEIFANPISVVLLTLIGLTPLTWFLHGTPILGVDSYFQLHPQHIPDIFSSWSAATSPGNPQVDNAAWLELAQEWLGRTFPVWVEQALILCIFASVGVFGFYALAKTFAGRVVLLVFPLRDRLPVVEIEIASIAVAALWVANPFTDSFNWWHMTLIQATWAEIPWIAYVIFRIRTLRLPLSILLGVFLGGLGRLTMTEPYLPQIAVIVVVVSACSLALDAAVVKTIGKLVAFFFGFGIGVISWLLPAYSILRIVVAGALNFGGTLSGNVHQAVAVTTMNATPLNVVSLTAWFTLYLSNFGVPYHQWSWLVQSASWNWIKLILPIWAVIGASWSLMKALHFPRGIGEKAERLLVIVGVLGGTICFGVFLASASKGPFPEMLNFVLRLPFGSAFRNPIDRTAGIIALPELLLVSVAFVLLSVQIRPKFFVAITIVAVTCLSLGFPYFANLTLPAGGGPVPGARAALPSQYDTVGATLSKLQPGGKTMVLPFSTSGNVALNWSQGVQSNTNCILQDWAPLRSTLCTVSGLQSADVVGEDLSRAITSGADFPALARVFGVDSWLVHNDFNQVFSGGFQSSAHSPSTYEMRLSSFASSGSIKSSGSSAGAVVVSENHHRADFLIRLDVLPKSGNLVVGDWGRLTIGVGVPGPYAVPGSFFTWISGPGGFYWPSESLSSFRSEVDISLIARASSSDFNVNGVPQYVDGTKDALNACGAASNYPVNPGSYFCSTGVFRSDQGKAVLHLSRDEALLKPACVLLRSGGCPLSPLSLGLHEVESGPFLSLWMQRSLPLIYVSTDATHVRRLSYMGLLNWARSVQSKRNPVLVTFNQGLRGVYLTRTVTRLSSTHYRFKLKLDGKAVVSFLNTFNLGWRLVSSNSSIHVGRHVTVNGYANGWIVTGNGLANMAVVYEPEISFARFEFANVLLTFTAGIAALLIMLADRR